MIRVAGVCKQFNGHPVLDDVSFVIPDRHVTVILGPSGTGKTVLLRIMAGLMLPDRGQVSYDEAVLGSPEFTGRHVVRRLGFVFQGGALFDSLSVADNVALPLRERERLSRAEVKRRVQSALARVGMSEHADQFPRELSGGMKRLVAIARAVAPDPQYIFFDEPTTGLDPVTKERICNLIAALRDEQGKTAIVVTHDLEAVKAVSDEILMLHDARVVPLDHASKEDYADVST
jgi:phospholipid/cholesterol/gamma-HCH transport system ATP-binding protein